MLKSVLYYLLLLTTGIRFADMIYLLARENTNLPIPVIVVTSVMIIYGFVLGVYKFISTIRLKQLLAFYVIQTVLFVFNLVYVAVACPLTISPAETLIVGTFLDLIINVSLVYIGMKHIRSFMMPAQNTSARTSINV